MNKHNGATPLPEPEFDPERINAAFRALEELTKPITITDLFKEPKCPITSSPPV